MHQFWQWLRAEIAPDGLPDPVLAFGAGTIAWVITNFLRAIFAWSVIRLVPNRRSHGLDLLGFCVDYGVGQPAQHSRAQLPSASVIIVLMVRAHRPHSALHPRHP